MVNVYQTIKIPSLYLLIKKIKQIEPIVFIDFQASFPRNNHNHIHHEQEELEKAEVEDSSFTETRLC